MRRQRQPLGEILVQAGLIDPRQLQTALSRSKESGRRLGEAIIGLGFASEADIAQALARQLNLPFLPDHQLKVDAHLTAKLPVLELHRRRMLPLAEEGAGRLRVAVVDPLDEPGLDELRYLLGAQAVQPVVVTSQAMDRALGEVARFRALKGREAISAEAVNVELPPETEAAPVVGLVSELIDRAISERASDIHIEAGENSVRIRLRIDGFLQEIMRPDVKLHGPIVARIKVMAGLDIAERRAPQDGRIEFRDGGRRVDLRVSTLPTIFGEKVVLRLFDRSRTLSTLDDLGMPPEILAAYRTLTGRPHGMIFVTGPTGSGKTTTLLSTLTELNNDDRNIVTIEDPVEYHVAGVNHVQVNPRHGLSFADGLRSILRQDPNVIMVGEVRDGETADVAVRAALTGHLVLSTLHTNDATGALTRLTDMGVEPFLIASSVLGVLAQRLVRRVCDRCAQPAPPPTPEWLAEHGLPAPPPESVLLTGTGCVHCRNTGYRGRLPIFELMVLNQELRDLVLRREGTSTLRAAARRAGMASLLSNGVAKAYAGLTTLQEVLRVAQADG
jgi:type IV pilus assembly protein PilB